MQNLDPVAQELSELLGRFLAVRAELSAALGAANLLLLKVADYLDDLQHPLNHPLVQAGAAFSRQLAVEVKAQEVG